MTEPRNEPRTEPPVLRVVSGNPSDEEVAALVTVLAARAAAAPAGRRPRPQRSQWSAHHRKLRRTHRPGPGAWRAAALP